jgi:hypothetical protein
LLEFRSRHPDAVKKHKKNFKDEQVDDDGAEDSKSLGTAAAMEALKRFTQGDTDGGKQSQGAFISFAMAEAVKVRWCGRWWSRRHLICLPPRMPKKNHKS